MASSPITLTVMFAAIIGVIGFLFIRIRSVFGGSNIFNRVLEFFIVVASVTAVVCAGLVLKNNADYLEADAPEAPSAEASSETPKPNTPTTKESPSVTDRPSSGTSLSTLNVTARDNRLFTGRSAGLGDTLYPDSIVYYCLGYGCLSHERSIRFEIDGKYTEFSAVVGVKKDAKDLNQVGEFTLISHGRDGIGKELGRWSVGYTDSPMETGTIDITGTQQLELRVRRTDVPGESEFNAVDLAWGDPKVFP